MAASSRMIWSSVVLGSAVALGCAKQQEPQAPLQQQYPQQYPPTQYSGGQQYPTQPGYAPAQQNPTYAPSPYPTAPQAAPSGQYGPPAAPTYPAAQPAPAQYPTGTYPAAGTPAPASVPGLPTAIPGVAAAPSGSPATPLDPSAAAALQPVLSQLAATKAPAGAKPMGAVMAANFQQGQQLEAQVQMEPGRCYTVVGAALPPVAELNLQIVALAPLPGMAPVLAVDNTSGNQAVLGERPNCFSWAWPVAAPVKVVVSVPGGSGLAAAQMFVK